jgi:hypothetical protein
MKKRLTFVGLGVVGLGLLLLVAAVTGFDAREAENITAGFEVTPIPSEMAVPPVDAPVESDQPAESIPIEGGSAIDVSPGVVTGQPAFDVADVTAFLEHHVFSFDAKLEAGKSVTEAATVEFITAGEAAERLRSELLESDRPIALVTLQGEFSVPGGDDGKPLASGSTAYIVFDARTGNLLMESIQR